MEDTPNEMCGNRLLSGAFTVTGLTPLPAHVLGGDKIACSHIHVLFIATAFLLSIAVAVVTVVLVRVAVVSQLGGLATLLSTADALLDDGLCRGEVLGSVR